MSEDRSFDAADYVRTPDDADVLLRTALEDAPEEPAAVKHALAIIERSGQPLPRWWTEGR